MVVHFKECSYCKIKLTRNIGTLGRETNGLSKNFKEESSLKLKIFAKLNLALFKILVYVPIFITVRLQSRTIKKVVQFKMIITAQTSTFLFT